MRGGDEIREVTDRAVEGNSVRGAEKLAATFFSRIPLRFKYLKNVFRQDNVRALERL